MLFKVKVKTLTCVPLHRPEEDWLETHGYYPWVWPWLITLAQAGAAKTPKVDTGTILHRKACSRRLHSSMWAPDPNACYIPSMALLSKRGLSKTLVLFTKPEVSYHSRSWQLSLSTQFIIFEKDLLELLNSRFKPCAEMLQLILPNT